MIFRYYVMPNWVLPFLFVFTIIASLSINEAFLPDYLNYYRIFDNTGTFYDELWRSDPGYYFLNRFFNNLGISYDFFRIILRFFSLIIFFLALYTLSRKSKRVHVSLNLLNSNALDDDRKTHLYFTKNTFLFSVIIILFLIVFFFEFFFIRIRAGLAISIFLLALSFLWGRSYINFFSLISFSFFLFLASSIHFTTTMVLVLMIGIPLLFSISTKFSIKSFKISKKLSDLFNILVLGAASLIVLFISFALASFRGEWLFVELNLVRLLSLLILPYFLFFMFRLFDKTAFKDIDIYTKRVTNDIKTKETFFQYCTKGYLLLVLYLPIFYVLGLTEQNGEAIVRIYTLSSVITVLSLYALPRKEFRNFWYLIGLSHTIFFVNSNFDLIFLMSNLI
jgi:hypothetical protein